MDSATTKRSADGSRCVGVVEIPWCEVEKVEQTVDRALADLRPLLVELLRRRVPVAARESR